MSNLLAIETAFLNNTQVKTAMQLTTIKQLKSAEKNAQKKKFDTSCAMSKLVYEAHEWFFNGEGKALAEREGIAWGKEEFALKVFGWQKSYFRKLIRTAQLDGSVIDRFNAECDTAESESKKVDRSIDGLLKFAKALENSSEANGEGSEGEGSEGEGGDISPSVERVPVLYTFAYKSPEGNNVSVRIDANGDVKTSNSRDEISNAIALFSAMLNKNNA